MKDMTWNSFKDVKPPLNKWIMLNYKGDIELLKVTNETGNFESYMAFDCYSCGFYKKFMLDNRARELVEQDMKWVLAPEHWFESCGWCGEKIPKHTCNLSMRNVHPVCQRNMSLAQPTKPKSFLERQEENILRALVLATIISALAYFSGKLIMMLLDLC